MALLFDDSNSQYANVASQPQSDYPITFSAWVYPDTNLGIPQGIINIGDLDANKPIDFHINAGEKLQATQYNGAFSSIATGNSVNLNAWNHVFMRAFVGTGVTVILNGDIGNKGFTSTLGAWPSGMDNTSFGVVNFNTQLKEFLSGALAEIAIWGEALTDAEALILSKAYSPLSLTNRLSSLNTYHDFIRDENRPGIGGDVSLINSPTVFAHPPIIYPSAQILQFPSAGAEALDNDLISSMHFLKMYQPTNLAQ